MKKLPLNSDTLAVESFITDAARALPGLRPQLMGAACSNPATPNTMLDTPNCTAIAC